jgi:hypothetical protein
LATWKKRHEDRGGKEKQLRTLYAFAARVGNQQWSEINRMTVAELTWFCDEVLELGGKKEES